MSVQHPHVDLVKDIHFVEGQPLVMEDTITEPAHIVFQETAVSKEQAQPMWQSYGRVSVPSTFTQSSFHPSDEFREILLQHFLAGDNLESPRDLPPQNPERKGIAIRKRAATLTQHNAMVATKNESSSNPTVSVALDPVVYNYIKPALWEVPMEEQGELDPEIGLEFRKLVVDDQDDALQKLSNLKKALRANLWNWLPAFDSVKAILSRTKSENATSSTHHKQLPIPTGFPHVPDTEVKWIDIALDAGFIITDVMISPERNPSISQATYVVLVPSFAIHTFGQKIRTKYPQTDVSVLPSQNIDAVAPGAGLFLRSMPWLPQSWDHFWTPVKIDHLPNLRNISDVAVEIMQSWMSPEGGYYGNEIADIPNSDWVQFLERESRELSSDGGLIDGAVNSVTLGNNMGSQVLVIGSDQSFLPVDGCINFDIPARSLPIHLYILGLIISSYRIENARRRFFFFLTGDTKGLPTIREPETVNPLNEINVLEIPGLRNPLFDTTRTIYKYFTNIYENGKHKRIKYVEDLEWNEDILNAVPNRGALAIMAFYLTGLSSYDNDVIVTAIENITPPDLLVNQQPFSERQKTWIHFCVNFLHDWKGLIARSNDTLKFKQQQLYFYLANPTSLQDLYDKVSKLIIILRIVRLFSQTSPISAVIHVPSKYTIAAIEALPLLQERSLGVFNQGQDGFLTTVSRNPKSQCLTLPVRGSSSPSTPPSS